MLGVKTGAPALFHKATKIVHVVFLPVASGMLSKTRYMLRV